MTPRHTLAALVVAACCHCGTEVDVSVLDAAPDRASPADTAPDDAAAPTDTAAVPDVAPPEDGAAPPDAVADTESPPSPDAPSPDAPSPDVAPDVSAPDASTPVRGLDRVHLHVNLGDSVGAGYNASPRDARGYAALVFRNHAAYPTYAGRDLATLFPGVRRVDRARSGWTTTDVARDLRGAVGSLPAGGPGDDTVVTVSAGGNDFNDDVRTIVTPALADAAAERAAANVAEVVRLLRARYHDPARGRTLVVLWTNVHDPTDGTGRVPAMYREGFCRTLQNPLFIDPVRAVALANLARFNDRLARALAADGALLVDSHRVFRGHGMTAPGADRWLSDDCVHPTDTGHHELRREVLGVLTGAR